MNVLLRKNLELLVGICSGIAIAYSDLLPFLGGICSGILLECAHPGLCNSVCTCVHSAVVGGKRRVFVSVQHSENNGDDDGDDDDTQHEQSDHKEVNVVTNDRGVMIT